MPKNNRKAERDSRVGLRLPDKLRKQIEKLAQQDQRSLSGMIVKLLTDAVSAKGERNG